MSKKNIINVILIVALFITTSSYLIYQIGHTDGYNAGYKHGYNVGENHVIYTQHITMNGDGKYVAIIDGKMHRYN